jgi:hypothetical protein
MIRHCVFIKFHPNVAVSEKKQIYSEISGLKARLAGLLAVHIGDNNSPEAGMDKGFSEGFMVDFSDAAARDAYLADSEHRLTGAKIVAAAQGGIAGILVYDIEIAESGRA